MKTYHQVCLFFILICLELSSGQIYLNKWYELTDVNNLNSNYSNLVRLQAKNQQRCLFSCVKLWNCDLVAFSANGECRLYQANNSQIISSIPNSLSNNTKLFRFINGLIHFWPLMNNTNDIVGGAHAVIGENASFIYASNVKNLYAIRLQSGYLNLPPDVYFYSDFSITAWVKIIQCSRWARLIDSDFKIIFALCNQTRPFPSFTIRPSFRIFSSNALNIGKWYHLTATLERNQGKLYINGVLNSTGYLITHPIKISNKTYIGKSNGKTDGSAFADIYNLKIFKRALLKEEIINEMNL